MKNNDKVTLFWAYFWRYGIIALGILPFIIIGGISAITDNYNYTLIIVSLLFIPSSLIVAGIYYIIGTKLEFTHLCCVYQSMNHKKMDPYRAEWTDTDKKDMKKVGITLLIVGILCFVGFLVCLINANVI